MEATMNVEQERSRSVWMETPAPELQPLAGDAETDVLVIGAGVAGLSTAYELACAGRRVMVLDRGRFGRGMTARTTAHLTFEIDDGFNDLAKGHGEDGARLWLESQAAAVDRVEAICRAEGIDCDFARVDGYLIPAKPADVDYLRKELDCARRVGFADAEWVEAGAQPGLEGPAIRFPRQARFHPLKYLDALTEALAGRGARLHDRTDVVELEERDGWVIAITGGRDVVRARQAVVATNTPFHLGVAVHTKQAPYRTYVIAAPVPTGSVLDALVWDTEKPGYHYVRLQPGEDESLLIVGGEDHKSGVESDGRARVVRLEQWMRERYPMAGAVSWCWSGQVYEPADYVGFVGRSPDSHEIYLVTGDSGQGMTTGVMASLLLKDLMSGAENPWARLYAPSRLMHRGLGEYVKENLEAAKHWLELVATRVVGSADEITAGDGALLRIKGKPVAAYRDDTGELHLASAACTHAGCVVHWNCFERCWDCPCHGSQFGPTGEVLNGPAVKPLTPIEVTPGEEAHIWPRHAPGS
jgi:glycine/D-amino acid oxidase-like deaminating enzyme/nitrite reductase/ring-hydroxylating ferredoxin subunit